MVLALTVFHRQDLLVHGCGFMESNVICLILSGDTLSEAQKSHILTYAKNVVNLQDETVDTKAEEDSYVWRGWHLGVWNRFAWTVSISCGSCMASYSVLHCFRAQIIQEQMRSGGAQPLPNRASPIWIVQSCLCLGTSTRNILGSVHTRCSMMLLERPCSLY